MRRIGTIVITVSLLLASTVFLTAQKENAEQVQLLRAGVPFRGDEVTAESGEQWLCLYKKGDKYYLIATEILVQKCVYICHDRPGDSTGKCVSVPEVARIGGVVVILIKGMKKYHQGPVQTVFHGRKILNPGQSMRWLVVAPAKVTDRRKNGDHYWSLFASGTFDMEEGPELSYYENYGMAVVRGRKSQVLFRHEKKLVPEGMPSPRWAGDLDGDGKLDLLIDTTDNYYGQRFTLFLSTYASEGELVGQVAQIIYGGC